MCQYWNSILEMADGVEKKKIPWLMMFDADLQITFFKLLRVSERREWTLRTRLIAEGKLFECGKSADFSSPSALRSHVFFSCFSNYDRSPIINYVNWIRARWAHKRECLLKIFTSRRRNENILLHCFLSHHPTIRNQPESRKENNSGEKFRKLMLAVGRDGGGVRWMKFLNLLFKWVEIYLKFAVDVCQIRKRFDFISFQSMRHFLLRWKFQTWRFMGKSMSENVFHEHPAVSSVELVVE